MTKIRIRHGDHEIEVEGTDKAIDDRLANFYERIEKMRGTADGPKSIKRQLLEPTSPEKTRTGKKPTPAEFFRDKGKNDGLSTILIFGKYLEDYENVTEFSRGDINRLAKEARLAKDIHAQYFTNGVKQGLLRKSGQRYSLTLSAEEVLTSM